MACLERQQGARYDAFVISGQPGREHLLAILTDEPLGLDWRPNDPNVPTQMLNPADIATLLDRLRDREGDR